MPPLILPLRECRDPVLVGGKAFGLFRLLSAGFAVPDGLCVTTEVYRRSFDGSGIDPDQRWQAVSRAVDTERLVALAECRSLILNVDLAVLMAHCFEQMESLGTPPHGRWAVRSSATQEDTEQASFAGLYRTILGVSPSDLDKAIKEVWASIWEERVIDYLLGSGRQLECPAIAVIIQPMVEAVASGVAYSIHPFAGRFNQVTINAVPGLGAPLVDGRVSPDQYVVEVSDEGQPAHMSTRMITEKSEKLIVTDDGLQSDPVPESEGASSSLGDDQAFALARVAKRLECLFGCPVDFEWAIDERQLWLLQARPITTIRAASDLTNEDCEWSRANFKETMPEVPSPLGLSFLEHFMDAYIIAHYRRLGCRIPDGLSAVRTLHGRPYLNVTLFHRLVGQLGGNPLLNVEQMGGEPLRSEPSFARLRWPSLIRAGWLMWRELRRVMTCGPRWFAEMKQLSATYHRNRIGRYSPDELAEHLDELGRWLDRREVTFGIAAGVGQCLQTFSALLPGWLGDDWRSLLNEALQGQGTVVSAQQVIRLAELVQNVRDDEVVSRGLLTQGWDLASVRRHAPDSSFVSAFDRYLDDYGHRGVGESDIMSPRFSDHPDALLDVIRVQLRGPASSPQAILDRQQAAREAALSAIRARVGWRLHRWIIFIWWYRRLCRFFSLREANRHHLMHYSTAVRTLLLCFGERLVERRIFESPEDVFFLTLAECAGLLSDGGRDWMALLRTRRAERDRCLAVSVPDTIRDWAGTVFSTTTPGSGLSDNGLRGIPISAGEATGPVRLVRSMADWSRVQAGDIIVAPVIDPGMAPLFGIAAGIVVEMGGILSHGAIIAREYGLPAVVNVSSAMRILKDGELITLNAGSGAVNRASTSGS